MSNKKTKGPVNIMPQVTETILNQLEPVVTEPVVTEPVVTEPIKKGRGRPKGTTKTKSEPQGLIDMSEDDFLKDVKHYKDTTATTTGTQSTTATGTTAKPITVNAAQFLTGALFLTIVDALMPTLILKVASYVSEDYNALKPRQIKLTKEQRAELAPLADEVVRIALGQIDPMALLLISMAAMYWENIQEPRK